MSDVQPVKLSVETHEGDFDAGNVKFLVYGESGVGKTVFASTWPRPVFLDIDKGMSSITLPVSRIPIQGWQDLQDAFVYLRDSDHDFETVVVDSVNELQYLSLENIIGEFPNVRRPYDSLASQSDYGKMLSDCERFVRFIKSLSMNVVYIANVAPREYEGEVIQPGFVGKKTSRNMARMMDVIGYIMKVENNEPAKTRRMIFDAVNHVTKDRSDVLPRQIEDPNYDTLFSYWSRRAEIMESRRA